MAFLIVMATGIALLFAYVVMVALILWLFDLFDD